MQKHPDVKHELSFLNAARHWLIKKIAGKHVVILNAKVTVMQNYHCVAHFKGCDGALIANAYFPATQNGDSFNDALLIEQFEG